MLEKLIFATILTLSLYIRYNPFTANQNLSQIQQQQPSETNLITWKVK
ncbi:MAG: hypothetical protein WBA77_15685 [Microcoleaceae cyanobacterium]